jgi:hypothetical protein
VERGRVVEHALDRAQRLGRDRSLRHSFCGCARAASRFATNSSSESCSAEYV